MTKEMLGTNGIIRQNPTHEPHYSMTKLWGCARLAGGPSEKWHILLGITGVSFQAEHVIPFIQLQLVVFGS